MDAHNELLILIHDSLKVEEFADILDGIDTSGVERGATMPQQVFPMKPQKPEMSEKPQNRINPKHAAARDTFSKAASKYKYTNETVVGHVFDTLLAKMVRCGAPAQLYVDEVCADEASFADVFDVMNMCGSSSRS